MSAGPTGRAGWLLVRAGCSCGLAAHALAARAGWLLVRGWLRARNAVKYNRCDAPPDPLGGPSPAPPLSVPARRRWGAGCARLLPRLPAALRQRTERLLCVVA